MEEMLNVAEGVMEGQAHGVVNMENGIRVLAAIGAGTCVYGVYRAGKWGFNRLKKAMQEKPEAAKESSAKPEEQVNS